MKKKIAVLPGDGVGPEVIHQAVKVLDAVADSSDHFFEYCYADIGAIAIEHTGDPLPAETIESCMSSDAVLLGATGHPRYDNEPDNVPRPEDGLLRLRKTLGLYANIRPVVSYPSISHLSPLRPEKVENVDLVIFRELTGGIYYGKKGLEGNYAYDVCEYHVHEIERIARLAFAEAMKRRKKLTVIDKSNVLQTSRLWRNTVRSIAESYPEVDTDFMYIDNATMQLIQYPRQFDVILTSNLFGDILSDEASVLAGSMGLLPSASIGEGTPLFEPIHGSYPQAAGEDIANPVGAILSAGMLLDTFGLATEAKVIRQTVFHLLQKGIGTAELELENQFSCSQIGDIVAYLVSEREYINMKDDKIIDRISTII